MPSPVPRTIVARHDDRLRATVVRRVPMVYRAGPDAALDRGAHVRAASAAAWVNGALAVLQDDASWIAMVDPESGRAEAIALPADAGGIRQFDDARGNKADKLDLEALIRVDDAEGSLLVGFGSGSSRRRERIALLRLAHDAGPQARIVHAPALYAALRADRGFAGGELNIEGAVVLGDHVRLFGRGNGAARDGRSSFDATCDVHLQGLLAYLAAPAASPPPELHDVLRYELGALHDVRLGFTDATAWGDRVLYLAAAEKSPDAVRDGAVAGSAVGTIGGDRRARWTTLADEHGAPLAAKAEGIAPHPGDPARLLVVADVDDHTRPSELLEVALQGPWEE